MLPVVDAVRVDGAAGDGRTEPLRVGVITESGELFEVYLKLPGPHLEIEGLMNEALALRMGAVLGLPMPPGYLVRIDPALAAAMPSLPVRARLAACPLAFGSHDLGANWRKWNSTNKLLPAQQRLALHVLAFDAFVGNPDRGPLRPNLMFSPASGQFALIDHECAFGFRMKRWPPVAPWMIGNLASLAQPGDGGHIFYPGLRRQVVVRYDEVAVNWGRLNDGVLSACEAALPPEWQSALPALREATAHVAKVRDRMGDCLKELGRVLS